MTSQALISKIHCTLLAHWKRDNNIKFNACGSYKRRVHTWYRVRVYVKLIFQSEIDFIVLENASYVSILLSRVLFLVLSFSLSSLYIFVLFVFYVSIVIRDFPVSRGTLVSRF